MSENRNRAFMYGESVFTTACMMGGAFRDWEYHFERLSRGVEYVYGPFTDGDNWLALLKNRLESRWSQESGDKVLRITVYREQERGLRRLGLASVSDLKIHVSALPYDSHRTEGKTLKLRTASAIPKPHWWPSYLKAGNYLETILAQKVFLQPEDDDLLFTSSSDTILSSSVANIFVVRHNKLYTPPVGPNVLEGIMRRKVLEMASDIFDEVLETETTLEQLYKADGVFGTNSVRGPFLVDRVDDHEINFDQEFLSKFDFLRNRTLA
jgi:branched-subunit amino acid aminotransferase/4-amino-4-deoxychorismate lyase